MNPVESTHLKTTQISHQSRWITYRASRDCDDSRTWIFTDGSSNGGFGAAIRRPGEPLLEANGYEAPTSTKNVGAELNGLLLALREARGGEQITVVSDYLGVAAWMTGNWQIKDQEVRSKINEAKSLIKQKSLGVNFCHHRGHQKDSSEFTRLNNIADRLASELTG